MTVKQKLLLADSPILRGKWKGFLYSQGGTKVVGTVEVELCGEPYRKIPSDGFKQEIRNVARARDPRPAVSHLAARHTQSAPEVAESGENAQATALPAPKVTLSSEQEHVLELVKTGRNVFFTGPAG
ncbi:hypothetical protein CONPUDRAFT_68908 [Coniophora puteana RWD-64-598 SS2]|uniref:Uncharacterized protein n=1 Tax=Coniophora puteana (strain RWD-64-598) TaxID=741705 RepID=A0A5M3N674_CONPW|nr:uncharacterized protein CONPUDRAFT_68908 [Coniophora puteana RWD-64-598 SS2]EIW86371.1 hypothetical protein CONPUDRAFT_68908 [Coniophora puteana RWD-64-598 SS2]